MLCENSELPTSVLTLFMKNNYLPYLRLRTAVYAAHMGITTQNTANIPIILVITANIDNLISLTDIPTVSRMIYFLSQPIVAMLYAMICPIDKCPVITLCRLLLRVLICLDLAHRLEISQVNCTGNMGRGSARDSRSHGNSRSGRGKFGWRNNGRRYSGTGQNSGLKNTNSQVVSRSDPTLNQKANLVYFDINEDVFHDGDASIIDGYISIFTPVISKDSRP